MSSDRESSCERSTRVINYTPCFEKIFPNHANRDSPNTRPSLPQGNQTSTQPNAYSIHEDLFRNESNGTSPVVQINLPSSGYISPLRYLNQLNETGFMPSSSPQNINLTDNVQQTEQQQPRQQNQLQPQQQTMINSNNLGLTLDALLSHSAAGDTQRRFEQPQQVQQQSNQVNCQSDNYQAMSHISPPPGPMQNANQSITSAYNSYSPTLTTTYRQANVPHTGSRGGPSATLCQNIANGPRAQLAARCMRNQQNMQQGVTPVVFHNYNGPQIYTTTAQQPMMAYNHQLHSAHQNQTNNFNGQVLPPTQQTVPTILNHNPMYQRQPRQQAQQAAQLRVFYPVQSPQPQSNLNQINTNQPISGNLINQMPSTASILTSTSIQPANQVYSNPSDSYNHGQNIPPPSQSASSRRSRDYTRQPYSKRVHTTPNNTACQMGPQIVNTNDYNSRVAQGPPQSGIPMPTYQPNSNQAVGTIPTRPPTSQKQHHSVEIQACPETLNKACQFMGAELINRSLNATVEMVDAGSQTEVEEMSEKAFVDRASSPIKFPPRDVPARRKFTAKRRKIEDGSSDTNNKPKGDTNTNDKTDCNISEESDSDINVLE